MKVPLIISICYILLFFNLLSTVIVTVLLLCSIISAGTVSAIVETLSLVVEIFAACYAMKQYKKHLDEERTNLLCEYNQRYSSDKNIEEVVTWMLKVSILDQNGDIIGADPHRVCYSPGIYKKEMFMRFFEELYLHIKENKISKQESCKLFSYYALKFDEFKEFRLDITDYISVKEEESHSKDKNPKKLLYWSNYRNYVKEMISEKKEEKEEEKKEEKEEESKNKEAEKSLCFTTKLINKFRKNNH